MAKQRIAHIEGMSNGTNNHPHGVLLELEDDASLLLNLQVTITGGADGKKRHASAKVSVEQLLAAVTMARNTQGTL